MIYLTLPELLYVAERAISDVHVRDVGLLQAALARPQATAFGEDAYPGLAEKAAAFMRSLARTHALVDGNKRLPLAALSAFLGMNGRRLTMSNDQSYDFVIPVATGQLDDVVAIASVLDKASESH